MLPQQRHQHKKILAEKISLTWRLTIKNQLGTSEPYSSSYEQNRCQYKGSFPPIVHIILQKSIYQICNTRIDLTFWKIVAHRIISFLITEKTERVLIKKGNQTIESLGRIHKKLGRKYMSLRNPTVDT